MSAEKAMWCAKCCLRIGISEPHQYFRSNPYHRHCLEKMRQAAAKARPEPMLETQTYMSEPADDLVRVRLK